MIRRDDFGTLDHVLTELDDARRTAGVGDTTDVVLAHIGIAIVSALWRIGDELQRVWERS